jgi:TIR domain-containing protein
MLQGAQHGWEGLGMAPEEVYSLVAVTLRMESGRLLADGERVRLPSGPLYVSWYTTSAADGQVPIAGGLVHVPAAPQLERDEIRNAEPADLGDSYKWRNPPPEGGPLMFAMSLPAGQTILQSEPKPVEAKQHKGAIAVFWILPPAMQVSLTWQMGALRKDLEEEIRRINREGLDQLLPTRRGGFDYDVALSFAGEDRPYVEQVATFLKAAGVKVFYDRFEEVSLWGKNLYDHLSEVYGKRARYTVMFISQHYAKKVWTNHERESAQARALEENSECILPARFDDTKVPGLRSTVGYLSLHGRDPKDLADLIAQKVGS